MVILILCQVEKKPRRNMGTATRREKHSMTALCQVRNARK